MFPIGCLCVLVGVLVLARRLGSISNNDDGTRRRIPPFSADTSITDGISTTPNQQLLLLRDALQQVQDAGYRVCAPPAEDKDERDTMMGRLVLAVPACEDAAYTTNTQRRSWRTLLEEEDPIVTTEGGEDTWMYVSNALCALLCITVAALAAGLTLGMLGLDPLLLLIKQRAATDLKERQAASRLLPVVQQHHRLLVTLLLMNAVANEALPIFLEALVPPAYAVLVSVTLVLFCGEIIPSAIFTGPNQIQIACALVPCVKFVMWILYPVAGPLARLLDWLLHDHGDGDHDGGDGEHTPSTSAAYTRGELAALIRIQYEERMAVKKRRKQFIQDELVLPGDHVGALDFTQHHEHRKSVRAAKHQIEHRTSVYSEPDDDSKTIASTIRSVASSTKESRDESLHVDEVSMIEGALKMSTKTAIDVFTSFRKVYAIPSDMLLTERNMVRIYSSGFTRIPVYEPGTKTAIVGVLMTKKLIVVDSREARPVSTLPLQIPRCVSPGTPLVVLVNMFQTGGRGGKGGHLALVCARPSAAEEALEMGQSVPETAGLMGIITLEDVLEMLLQEQIYDEMDKVERKNHRLAMKVLRRWRRYVEKKKTGQLGTPDAAPAIFPVVEHAVAAAKAAGKTDAKASEEGMVAAAAAAETTALLGDPSKKNNYSNQV